jgi:hypothetical protein
MIPNQIHRVELIKQSLKDFIMQSRAFEHNKNEAQIDQQDGGLLGKDEV